MEGAVFTPNAGNLMVSKLSLTCVASFKVSFLFIFFSQRETGEEKLTVMITIMMDLDQKKRTGRALHALPGLSFMYNEFSLTRGGMFNVTPPPYWREWVGGHICWLEKTLLICTIAGASLIVLEAPMSEPKQITTKLDEKKTQTKSIPQLLLDSLDKILRKMELF